MKQKEKNIINTAEKVFECYGYKKTTMDDIAEEVRIGKATIYYYYSGKLEIFFKVIRKDCEKFNSKLDTEVSE
ncbi:MAG: TetR/AcrR family transcriptional regulator [Candidatus Celaenobacter antarcticus]|nr:TetR/AcrR family transcriptional regulator [Candidatus Celaenobacter antarcticus]